MKKPLTKEHWMRFTACRHTAWLFFNQPEVFPKPDYERLKELKDGNAVDAFARQACQNAAFLAYLGLSDWTVYTQYSVEAASCLIKADILAFKDNQVQIFEVKASTLNSKNIQRFLPDIGFQTFVLAQKGYNVVRAGLIGLHPDFVFTGHPINPIDYFSWADVTAEVEALMPALAADLPQMIALFEAPEPQPQPHVCADKMDCIVLQRYFKDKITDKSIFHLARLRGSKMALLLEQGIWNMTDIPEDFQLTKDQKLQIKATQTQAVSIDTAAIRDWLSACQYPLYFLDYETVNAVFPYQIGYKPYGQMVFQFSLHILDRPDAPLRHVEYLLRSTEEPVTALLEALQKEITDENGHVLVWNMGFESGRNKEMAQIFPQYAPFLTRLNAQMRDLALPFEKKWYIDEAFKGRYSIKYVLPVLVPELSYQTLAVQNGTMAVSAWLEMVETTDPIKQQQAYEALLAYCHLDTLAMYHIYEFLKKI